MRLNGIGGWGSASSKVVQVFKIGDCALLSNVPVLQANATAKNVENEVFN